MSGPEGSEAHCLSAIETAAVDIATLAGDLATLARDKVSVLLGGIPETGCDPGNEKKPQLDAVVDRVADSFSQARDSLALARSQVERL